MIGSSSGPTTGTPAISLHSNHLLPINVNDLNVIQDMIDCSADRLEGLRTQCSTSATLTQREIRSLETKLLRMFSELLLTRSRMNQRLLLPSNDHTHSNQHELKQWLRVVGLTEASINICLSRLSSLEELLELIDSELKELITKNPDYRDEELRRITKSIHNLRTCKELLNSSSNALNQEHEQQQQGDSKQTKEEREHLIEQLFWDSWDHHHQSQHQHHTPQHLHSSGLSYQPSNHHTFHRASVGNIIGNSSSGSILSPQTHRMLIARHVAGKHQHHQLTASSSRKHSPASDGGNSSTPISTTATTTSLTSKMSSSTMDNIAASGSVLTLPLTPSPPNSPFSIQTNIGNNNENMTVNHSLNSTPQRSTQRNIIGTTPPSERNNFQTFNNNTQQQQHHHQQLTIAGAEENNAINNQMDNPLHKSTFNEIQQTMMDNNINYATTVSNTASTILGSGLTVTSVNQPQYSHRTRLNTDPSPDSHSTASSDILFVESSNNINCNNLQVPLSPCTPIVNLGMSHSIAHRFNTVFKMTSTTCDLCQKPMFIGRKCKECKYRCHKLCEPDVPPSCCLPPEFIDEFKNAIKDPVGYQATFQQHNNTPPNMIHSSSSYSPNNFTRNRLSIGIGRHQHKYSHSSVNCVGICGANSTNEIGSSILAGTSNVSGVNLGESSSPASSCTSSNPSSPALFNVQHQHQYQQQQHQQQQLCSSTNITAFMHGSGNIMSSSTGEIGLNSMLPTSSSITHPAAQSMSKVTTSVVASQFHFPDVAITSNSGSQYLRGGNTKTLNSVDPLSSTIILDGQTNEFSHQMNENKAETRLHYRTLNDENESTIVPIVVSTITASTATLSLTSSLGASLTSSFNNNTPNITSNVQLSTGLEGNLAQGTNNKNFNCNNHLVNYNLISNCNHGENNLIISPSTSITITTVTTSVVTSTTTTTVIKSHYPSIINNRQTFLTRKQFNELADTNKSNDSDKTISLSGSTSASTDSDRTPVRLDSTEDSDIGIWRRQNSMSLKEWDIPFGDLLMLEKIGQGRFGTVHRALWHGSVAVKLLKEDYLDDEQMLEAFKLEVANFKKTRHENLVLFMGACMNPPYLAIVTSLCKGNTLYTHIHTRREKFVINRTTLIAQQITQGMGYLHARGIIHKDLRTKNIFLENGKVIITDFGLFSSTKLLYGEKGLGVPSSWLCYLAPELMRGLMPSKPSDEILPYSMASDIYSFGTVWYELLCGEFPFKSQPPEAVIWQVGRGMKQTLANLQTSRDVKDILMLCWHYTADDRPDFPKLLTLFERLPKKRLARSPSHPVQLSRSAEAIF